MMYVPLRTLTELNLDVTTLVVISDEEDEVRAL